MSFKLLLFLLLFYTYTSINVFGQNEAENKNGIAQQLLGCWTNVKVPSSQLCFESDGRLLFKNSEADKTIRRKWNVLKNGLIRIKFIWLYKPLYRIEALTEDYVKLAPVHKGILIELKR